MPDAAQNGLLRQTAAGVTIACTRTSRLTTSPASATAALLKAVKISAVSASIRHCFVESTMPNPGITKRICRRS